MKMETCLKSANQVLDPAIMKNVPKSVLRGCKGVAVIRGTEFAIGITGGGGSGVMLKHNEDGSWSPPAAISMNFVGVGADVGIAEKFILIVPMTDGAFKSIMDDKIKLGTDAALAAGPGVETEASLANYDTPPVLNADYAPIYTYAFERGLMIKVGITGSSIEHKTSANEEFYGINKSPEEILTQPGAVTLPEGNADLDELYKNLAAAN